MTMEWMKGKDESKNSTDNAPVRRTYIPKPKKLKIPDFNDIIQFCDKYRNDDIEIEQFFQHTIPRRLYKKKYNEDRGGGGWSGAVKATINILRKMLNKGNL